MVSIAHWLDTFTCSKYADRFERSGYQNLQSVRDYSQLRELLFLLLSRTHYSI